MALDGIIFDLDGTLVDSNAAHIGAWQRAFARHGYKIPADRVFVEVGKGGDQLVPHLLGKEADEKDGESLRAAQPEEYAAIVRAGGLRVFPRARELVAALRGRGLRTVLATSSSQSQLEATSQASGVDWPAQFDAITSADDAERSKPAPDIVSAAVKKLNFSPAQCAMIGDTPYDAESSKQAGVICLGVTAGGRQAGDLLASGARAVWRDPADLLANLDEVLRTASPGSAHLTQDFLETLMREALSAAREGMADGEVPIGAAIALGDGQIIARGFNRQNRTQNRTAHAEIVAFANAAGKVPAEAPDLILISTLEPCVMCLGAAMVSFADTVIYGLKAPPDRGSTRVRPPQAPHSQMPRIVGDVLAEESRTLFQQWLQHPGRNPRQTGSIRQLLETT